MSSSEMIVAQRASLTTCAATVTVQVPRIGPGKMARGSASRAAAGAVPQTSRFPLAGSNLGSTSVNKPLPLSP